MTRDEFNRIDSVEELLDIARDCECYDVYDKVYSSDGRDDNLDESMYSYAEDYGWRDMLDMLRGWESEDGYEWYLYDEYGNYIGLEDDSYEFRELKAELLSYLSEGGYFDEEDFDEEFVEEVGAEQAMEEWTDGEFENFVAEFQTI